MTGTRFWEPSKPTMAYCSLSPSQPKNAIMGCPRANPQPITMTAESRFLPPHLQTMDSRRILPWPGRTVAWWLDEGRAYLLTAGNWKLLNWQKMGVEDLKKWQRKLSTEWIWWSPASRKILTCFIPAEINFPSSCEKHSLDWSIFHGRLLPASMETHQSHQHVNSWRHWYWHKNTSPRHVRPICNMDYGEVKKFESHCHIVDFCPPQKCIDDFCPSAVQSN